jgi:uncharacterized protein
MSRAALEQLMRTLGAGGCMNLEALDGFFCALAASPVFVLPSQFLPLVRFEGGVPLSADEGLDMDETTAALILQYYNEVIQDFAEDGSHEPILFEETGNNPSCEAWARGYLYGVEMHSSEWGPSLAGELKPWLGLLLALAGEIELSTSERAELFSDHSSPEIVCVAFAAKAYEYFAEARASRVQEADDSRVQDTLTFAPRTLIRRHPKIGRNESCPCGSGRKHKRCCLSQ